MSAIVNFLLAVFMVAAKGATADSGLDLLRKLVAVQSSTPDALARVEAKVDALVGAEFAAGQRHLSDALADWRTQEDRKRLLWEAHNAFTRAEVQETSWLRRSFAAMHLAATWAALGKDRRDVERTLLRAHVHAGRAADIAESGVWEPRQWVNRDLVPYLNALAKTRRAWGASPEQAPLFFMSPDEATADAVRDWRTWAQRYDRALTNRWPATRKEVEDAAISFGVDADEMRAALDAIGRRELRSVQFVDIWVGGSSE